MLLKTPNISNANISPFSSLNLSLQLQWLREIGFASKVANFPPLVIVVVGGGKNAVDNAVFGGGRGVSLLAFVAVEFALVVGRFRLWSEVTLVHVCDRLKPVVHAKPDSNSIVRKGERIDEMSIVLQGKLCTFSSQDTGSTSNVSRESRKDLLKEGDLFGEELVNWVQDEPSSSKKLISNRTITALTKVEALVLRTDDLKDIYNQKAKVIQSFFRKKRIMISGRNGQTPPGELTTALEIVLERI
ncbi:hypothetical protein LWI29_005948 [Acer saccharum]|uniref:Cyclic nucleotide-binding domain-containing protein n=1 Tax=Acer saccharum TaxID=4024 RepID=A0AA39SRR7_ACESA|nr:hypothetical protein LWI29_005948 [Acer saccharum]